MAYDVEELVTTAAARNASDIHLIAGLPPKCRIDGALVNLHDEVLTHDNCESIAASLAGAAEYERMKKIGEALTSLALELERVGQFEIAIDEFDKVPKIINDFVESVEALGPNPFKGF